MTRVSPNLKILAEIPDELPSSGVYCTVHRFTWLGSQDRVHVALQG